jgi:serine/threonine-protein kinase
LGLVYEAEHLLLGSPVALKVLRPELLEQPGMLERFNAEARCMAQLRGEHAVRVLDAGRLDTGLPFIVMECLRGLDLRALLLRCRRLPSTLAVDYVRQACAALAEVHGAGWIHCDIKPSNLFVTAHASGQSQIKLLDFGIARRASASGSCDDAPLGTASYASPEQRACGEVGVTTDIWSLGVVAFEALTGALPADRARAERAAPGSGRREAEPALPRGLGAVLSRCLAHEPRQRFSSASELSAALAPFVASRAGDGAALSRGRRPHRARGAWRADGPACRPWVSAGARSGRSLRRGPSVGSLALPRRDADLFRRP